MALSSSWTTTPVMTQCGGRRTGCRDLPTVKVWVVGGANAGKADLLHAYTEGRYPLTERPRQQRVVAMSAFSSTTLHVGDLPVDAPRPPTSSSRTRRVGHRTAEAVVAVYSVEDPGTLEEAVGQVSELLADPTHPVSRAVLVGTWRGARPQRRRVTYKQGKDQADVLGADFTEWGFNTSSSRGVQGTVHQLAEACLKDWEETHAASVNDKKYVETSLKACIRKMANIIRMR